MGPLYGMPARINNHQYKFKLQLQEGIVGSDVHASTHLTWRGVPSPFGILGTGCWIESSSHHVMCAAHSEWVGHLLFVYWIRLVIFLSSRHNRVGMSGF